ncbi:MAG TPA: VWA domain-containing protein [Candidatus Acidoferrum sp.]|nr:VWA domain-containing protein [Candidatus Acidoferrum sp.]
MRSSAEARCLAAPAALSFALIRSKFFSCTPLLIISLILTFAAVPSLAQDASPKAPQPTLAAQSNSAQNTVELASHDEPATFKVNVKLVVVRAVVRDAQGRAVGNLHQEDFEIFDKGKPQVISQFEVEQPGTLAAKARQNVEENIDKLPESLPSKSASESTAPERFVAYLFDDIHLEFGDLARVREAAQRHFSTLRPTDRAAIFTTSGLTVLDFTDDRTKLHDALFHLNPHPISRHTNDCPDISYYQADQIINKNDPEALQIAIQEATGCEPLKITPGTTGVPLGNPTATVSAVSASVLAAGDHESNISLGLLKQTVQVISHMPGQRSIVLASPGFIAPRMEYETNEIVDRAVRSQVIINTLDARGLFVVMPFGDASHQPTNPLGGDHAPPPGKALIEIAAANANDDLLATLADSTGGVFFHNNNDFDEGFRRVAQTPEYSYVLAFAPQNLKLDGSYHILKVKLKNPQKLTLQARRGYYAPKHFADPNEQAKQEIEDAMYSQEELHNLPVKLHTQFFKSSDADAKLVVLAHVDVQHLHFRKLEGRNNNVLTCVSAVFNRNGNFVQGMEKTVTMNLKDETLEHKLASGITLKTSFDVKPGSYLVRLVVRDEQGQAMSAENGTVEIR